MPEDIIPQEIKDHYNKATIAIEKKNYKYAVELLTHVISVRPDFAKGRQLLRVAEIKNFEENTPNALSHIITKIVSSFTSLIALVNEAKGDYHAAMSTYEKILRKDPKNAAVLLKLGNLLLLEDMKETSMVTLEIAVSISPKNPLAYELLGEIYSDLGNYDRARSCFKKVLELKPYDANAERGLKNIDALTTIEKSFDKKDSKNLRIREVKE